MDERGFVGGGRCGKPVLVSRANALLKRRRWGRRGVVKWLQRCHEMGNAATKRHGGSISPLEELATQIFGVNRRTSRGRDLFRRFRPPVFPQAQGEAITLLAERHRLLRHRRGARAGPVRRRWQRDAAAGRCAELGYAAGRSTFWNPRARFAFGGLELAPFRSKRATAPTCSRSAGLWSWMYRLSQRLAAGWGWEFPGRSFVLSEVRSNG
jgi:hypothetical protein